MGTCSIKTKRSNLVILFGCVLAAILVWAENGLAQQAPVQTFTATMITTINDNTSSATIWTQPGLLRMNVQGGRQSSGMLTHYAAGKTWALIPSAMKYQEFSTRTLRDNVPHFFDPALRVEKKLLGEDTVEGRAALKYQAQVHDPQRRDYQGFLWEAKDLPGYPLQWQDANRQISTIWRDSQLVEKPASFFELPADYTEQVAVQSTPLPPKPRCQPSANQAKD